jgi:hypothetical protein
MKKHKIIFWVTTSILFLFQGVMPALTSHTEMAREGIRQLGYPGYFGTMLAMFKVAGSVVLIVPAFPRRLREWAYAGFAIDFIAATISIGVVFGIGLEVLSPIIALLILTASYTSYEKLQGKVTGSLERYTLQLAKK